MSAIIWDTEFKDIPRQIVMQKRGRPARVALTMPAGKMLCTKAGKKSGLINEHTRHIFIESDQNVQRQIRNEIKKSGCEWDAIMWPAPADELNLKQEIGNTKLDFVYLDYCKPIRGYEARWLYETLGPALSTDALVAITANRCWRNESFMRWWVQDAIKNNPEVRKLSLRAEKMLHASPCAGQVGDLTAYLDDSQVSFEDDFMIPGKTRRGWAKALIPKYNQPTIDLVSLMLLIFCDFNFKIGACVEYHRTGDRSSSPMTTIVMTDMQPRSRCRISKNLLFEFKANMRPTRAITL